MRARTALVAAALVTAPLAACGSSASTTADGTPIVNWYIGNESWLPDVIEACNGAADGAFELRAQSLPTNPDQQREQLVRRLAARDSSIDLIGMDVVWTSEFGQAGWVEPFEEGELDNVGTEEQVLTGPYQSALYDGEQYGAPLNSNTRLLWYRKSGLGDTPVPRTWDELLDAADALGTTIQETGRRAESLTVFFNALVESAGTSIVEPTDDGGTQVAARGGRDGQGARDHAAVRRRLGRPAGAVDQRRGRQPARLPGAGQRRAFMINWPYVYPSVLEADPALAEDYGVAPYPRVDPDQPAAAPLGGYNLGIGPTRRTATRRWQRSTASPSRRSSAPSPPSAASRRCCASWPTTPRSPRCCRSCRS